MKKLKKILFITFSIVIITIVIGLSYIKIALPNVGEPEKFTIESNDELIKHGEYLANNVMVCMDCHSERDWSKFSGPLVEGTLGKGGEVFDQNLGFPGTFTAKNITPYKLSSWTDGEILRAISTGVSKDGNALFPIMPYTHYGNIDRKDLEAIIAYIRTLPSLKSEVPASSPDFPMNFIINTLPQKANFIKKPSEKNLLAYGKYLVNAAACFDCHTKQEKGEFIGKDFAGGMEFKLSDGSIVRSPNITPDKTTGIGGWSEEQFVERFKMYADSNYIPHTVEKGLFQTVMPWTMYGGMKESDLKAIYTYLKSIKVEKNSVERFTSSLK